MGSFIHSKICLFRFKVVVQLNDWMVDRCLCFEQRRLQSRRDWVSSQYLSLGLDQLYVHHWGHSSLKLGHLHLFSQQRKKRHSTTRQRSKVSDSMSEFIQIYFEEIKEVYLRARLCLCAFATPLIIIIAWSEVCLPGSDLEFFDFTLSNQNWTLLKLSVLVQSYTIASMSAPEIYFRLQHESSLIDEVTKWYVWLFCFEMNFYKFELKNKRIGRKSESNNPL